MNINRRGGAKGRKRFCHNDLSDLITNVKTAARKPAPFSDSTHFNPSPRQHWHFLHQLTLKQAAEHLRRHPGLGRLVASPPSSACAILQNVP